MRPASRAGRHYTRRLQRSLDVIVQKLEQARGGGEGQKIRGESERETRDYGAKEGEKDTRGFVGCYLLHAVFAQVRHISYTGKE